MVRYTFIACSFAGRRSQDLYGFFGLQTVRHQTFMNFSFTAESSSDLTRLVVALGTEYLFRNEERPFRSILAATYPRAHCVRLKNATHLPEFFAFSGQDILMKPSHLQR